MLVGNKSDRVTEREVSTQEGHALARDLGCEFVEASAKNCVNVERAFYDVVRILRRQRQISAKRTQGPGTNDGNEPQGSRPGGKSRRGTRSGRKPMCIILWTSHPMTDGRSFSSLCYFLWFEMRFCKHFKNLEQTPFSYSTLLIFCCKWEGTFSRMIFFFFFSKPFLHPFHFSIFHFFFSFILTLSLLKPTVMVYVCRGVFFSLFLVRCWDWFYFFTTLFREKKAFFSFCSDSFSLFSFKFSFITLVSSK